MAKITWLGEDELHYGDAAGPSFTTAFGGIKFPKDVAVEVTDRDYIARARKNKFFAVSDAEPAAEADDGGLVGDPRFPAPVKRKPGRPRKDEAADVED